MLTIETIVLRTVRLKPREVFTTAFGAIAERDQLIVEIKASGLSGWGEVAAFPLPFYEPETIESAYQVLKSLLIPQVFKHSPQNPEQLNKIFESVSGNSAAKAGLELAFWDLYAKRLGKPLFSLLGGVRTEIEVGVSVPLYATESETLRRILQFLEQGYKRIKIKIKPGNELSLVQVLFREFPKLNLQVDANGSYSSENKDLLLQLDQFPVLMIEQPFAAGDLVEHAELQSTLKIPICLDESIRDRHSCAAAMQLKSCKVIAIKSARLGGLQEAKLIHDLAQAHNIPVWCGGMLETAIGRAHNMALATLPNFKFPGDISESRRYFEEDLFDIRFSKPGVLALPQDAGIGIEINEGTLDRFCSHSESFPP